MIKQLLFSIFILVFGVGHVCAADEKSIYQERLANWVKNISTNQPSEEVFKPLLEFQKEFPDSEYSNDIQWLILVGLMATGDYRPQAWEALAHKSPSGKLTDETKEIMRNSIPEVDIPYARWTIRMKASQAIFKEKNYTDGVTYLTQYLKDFDFSGLKAEEYSADRMLLACYKQLKQQDEFNQLKSVMLKNFPEKSEKINKIIFETMLK